MAKNKSCWQTNISDIFPTNKFLSHARSFTFFLSEFPNGTILHRRLKITYDLGDYEIYFYPLGSGEESNMRRVYKICSPSGMNFISNN